MLTFALTADSVLPRGWVEDDRMSGQGEARPSAPDAAVSGPRKRSAIAFPYMDLKSAIELADAIYNNVGTGDCDDDQLAAWTKQSSKSSTFRVQVYAARTFGVLAGESSRHRVTELGAAIIDSQRAREAKVKAFFAVPLYAALFEKFKGGALPPAAALEREIEALGVAPKQKDRARQVFERSADQAGFFAHGRDRLVQPRLAANPPPPKQEDNPPPPPPGGGGSGSGGGATGDMLLDALIAKLPRPGAAWAVVERVNWLTMMAMGFQMAYGDDTKIDIKLAG